VSLSIRELGLRDTEVLIELMDAVTGAWSDRLAPGASGPLAFLADPATFVFGAWDADEPSGWAHGAVFRRPSGERSTCLHGLAVAGGSRRRGIATLLFEASLGWARRHGSDRFWLATSGDDTATQALCGSLGGERRPLGDVNYWWSLESGPEVDRRGVGNT
jgi:GNAT superfamily N-acetyltransferase